MKKKDPIFNQESPRILNESQPDTHQNVVTFADPTICRNCGVLFNNGRWSWDDLPDEAHEALCPACQRIADNHPAGYIELKGSFFEQHEEEILKLIRNIALVEQLQYPLERIIKIDPVEDHTVVTTTGMHLAQRIGDALERSYWGELEYNYDTLNYIHVRWYR